MSQTLTNITLKIWRQNGPDGQGRYLVVVNSGFGVQFDAQLTEGQTITLQ